MKLLILLTSVAVIGVGAGLETAKNNKVAEKDAAPTTEMESSDYRVIKVNGRILYRRNGKDMSQGDIFSPKEQLTFKTLESRAAVISKLTGRKILSPKDKSTSKATLLPAMNNPSTRAGALITLIDLKNHFANKYLVLDRMELTISPKSFPMGESTFFFMRYNYEGETINKKLSHSGEKLIIDKDELYKIDGNPIDGDKVESVSLYYREGKKSTLINSFQLIFPESDDLKTEVEIILLELEGGSEKERLDEVSSYLNEYYGKPNTDNLKVWMDAQGIK